MELVFGAQNAVTLALGVAVFALGLFAFIDALRHDKAAFAVEGKQSKTFWTIALGVSLAVLFVSIQSVLNMFALIAVVAVGVYLADVRPAITPHRAYRRRKGGASGQGPYGSW
ncbi:DUF2516 family protein [Mobilicoccus sp.]|uniref:DUF2516 family protein n=1 Tax=Mobilicoccus sp. TaxID=2034349 RepID=UPI0028A847DA|nr:DUF2516 family protein [Mobilicoccus sp.]